VKPIKFMLFKSIVHDALITDDDCTLDDCFQLQLVAKTMSSCLLLVIVNLPDIWQRQNWIVLSNRPCIFLGHSLKFRTVPGKSGWMVTLYIQLTLSHIVFLCIVIVGMYVQGEPKTRTVFRSL